MNAIVWIRIWFITVILISGTIVIFNFVIDPYGFNKMINVRGINSIKEDNTRFPFKYKMPLIAEGGWSNLMLGTSKIGVMDTQPVDKLLGGKTFNFSLPASTIVSQYDAFMYAMQFNNIKNVIYGVDFLSFNKNLKLNDNYLQFREKLQSFARVYNFDIYFNFDTLKASLRAIGNNRSPYPKLHPYYSKSSVRHYANFIQLAEKPNFDMEKRIHKLIQEWFRDWVYIDYEFSYDDLNLFKKIVEYCHVNDINLYVYIPPMYKEHFDAIRESGLKDEFETFKRELAKNIDFIDFTGVNKITKNPNNFWDSTHLRIENTATIMNRVIHHTNMKSNKDLGVMVNKNNIQKHLKKQDHEYQKINLKEIFNEDLEDVVTY